MIQFDHLQESLNIIIRILIWVGKMRRSGRLIELSTVFILILPVLMVQGSDSLEEQDIRLDPPIDPGVQLEWSTIIFESEG